MAAMESFICWQLSDWIVRGWRAVNSRERGVARSGAAVRARRVRIVVWNCMVYLLLRAADNRMGRGDVLFGSEKTILELLWNN